MNIRFRLLHLLLAVGLSSLFSGMLTAAFTSGTGPDSRALDKLQAATIEAESDARVASDHTVCVVTITSHDPQFPGEIGLGFVGGYTSWQETPNLRRALAGAIGLRGTP